MVNFTLDDKYKLIYLASPYSHPDPQVMEHRYEQAVLATAILLHKGHLVFSPITHSHDMSKVYPELVGTRWENWQLLDSTLIHRMDELWVLCIDGWRESVGVQAEIQLAKGYGRKIRAVLPVDLENFQLEILEGEPQ